MQNVQYPLQNMQYQTKLSPSYPQSYPQKGATPCKTCSTTCKIRSDQCKTCSTHCKIRSTPCKICSTKQSYPQVIHKVIPKKVLPPAKHVVPHAKYAVLPAKYSVLHEKYAVPPAKYAVPTAKHAVPHAKYAVPTAKYAVSNKVIPKLSPELSPMDLSKKNGLEK